MSLVAWVPPPEWSERAFASEPGGGHPSVQFETTAGWRAGRCVSDCFERYGKYGEGECDCPLPTRRALVLFLDGHPCPLSMMRASALRVEAGTSRGSAYSTLGMTHDVALANTLVCVLVDHIGGEIVVQGPLPGLSSTTNKRVGIL